MDNLIHIVGEQLKYWDEEASDPKRYSIFTQNLMLAAKVSQRQHLTHKSSALTEDDKSFHSAESEQLSVTRGETGPPLPLSRRSTLANSGRSRTAGRIRRSSRQGPPGDWTWKPVIPHRTSSMSTRCRKGNGRRHADLATFHRRSCQLFSSLDSTLSNAASTDSTRTRTSTSTSPSLASTVTTQATSILDENGHTRPSFPPFPVDIHDSSEPSSRNPSPTSDFGSLLVDSAPRLGSRRSSSQLDPQITSTKQVFWTTDATRQAEYAKIDAAHVGFKGLVKRILPRRWGWAHGKRRNFYEPEPRTASDFMKSRSSDEDSVRRFRVSVASATQEAIRGANSHAASRAVTPLSFDGDITATDAQLDPEPAQLLERTAKPKPKPVKKMLGKVRSSDALSKMFKPSSRVAKNERKVKTLSRDMGI